jgi:acid phosphatase family membrane protein YuiD
MISDTTLTVLLPAFPLIAGLLGMLLAQGIKVLDQLRKHKRLIWRRLMAPGGMPSSHASLVTGLTASVGVQYGWLSMPFSICAVFSLVVLYDAAGVRYAAGRHATVLNHMLKTFDNEQHEELTESLGHTPFEIFIGILIGIASVWGLCQLGFQ